MPVFFSRQCEYALRAVLYLAAKPGGGPVPIREIANELAISGQFLAKIFQDLSRKKLLSSRKGPKGGFRLRRSSARITLYDVVEAIDGVQLMEECVMGFPRCSKKNPCLLHRRWAGIRSELTEALAGKNIGDLATAVRTNPGAYRR